LSIKRRLPSKEHAPKHKIKPFMSNDFVNDVFVMRSRSTVQGFRRWLSIIEHLTHHHLHDTVVIVDPQLQRMPLLPERLNDLAHSLHRIRWFG